MAEACFEDEAAANWLDEDAPEGEAIGEDGVEATTGGDTAGVEELGTVVDEATAVGVGSGFGLEFANAGSSSVESLDDEEARVS